MSETEKKYHEQLIRHAAELDEGIACELLERLTFEREVTADGTVSEPKLVNRRFDLRTGQAVVHVEGEVYALRDEGTRLRICS